MAEPLESDGTIPEGGWKGPNAHDKAAGQAFDATLDLAEGAVGATAVFSWPLLATRDSVARAIAMSTWLAA